MLERDMERVFVAIEKNPDPSLLGWSYGTALFTLRADDRDAASEAAAKAAGPKDLIVISLAAWRTDKRSEPEVPTVEEFVAASSD